jgi:hypothetical protein
VGKGPGQDIRGGEGGAGGRVGGWMVVGRGGDQCCRHQRSTCYLTHSAFTITHTPDPRASTHPTLPT